MSILKFNQVRPVEIIERDVEMGTQSVESPKQRDFPMIGISLVGIHHFIESIGGHNVLEGLMTEDVNQKHIIPTTSSKFVSYCDYLSLEGKTEFVGQANVFISHAWKYQFLTVVDTLDQYFKDVTSENEIFLWFDLFSNNQNFYEPLPFTWWCDVFMLAIKKIGWVVMVMEPWNDPIPLTRAWCLWEIYSTEKTGSRFDVAMTSTSTEQFLSSIVENSELFTDMLSNVDVRKSEAKVIQDRDQIFDVIMTSIGFQNLNKLVNDRLRNWVYVSVQDRISEIFNKINSIPYDSEEEKQSNDLERHTLVLQCFRLSLAGFDLLSQQKRYHDIQVFTMPWSSALPNLIVEHDYITAKLMIYRNMWSSGIHVKYECIADMFPDHVLGVGEYAQKCIDACSKLSLSDPANKEKYTLLELQAHREKARDTVTVGIGMKGWTELGYIKHCLEMHVAKFGEEHRYTLECYSMLTGALRATGKYKEAESFGIRTIEGRKKTLGNHHPATLESMKVLGELYYWIGDYKRSTLVLTECYSFCIEKFGEEGEISIEVKQLLDSANPCHNLPCCLFVDQLKIWSSCFFCCFVEHPCSQIKNMCKDWNEGSCCDKCNALFTATVLLLYFPLFYVGACLTVLLICMWLILKVICVWVYFRISNMLGGGCVSQSYAINFRQNSEKRCASFDLWIRRIYLFLACMTPIIPVIFVVIAAVEPHHGGNKSSDAQPTSYPTSYPSLYPTLSP